MANAIAAGLLQTLLSLVPGGTQMVPLAGSSPLAQIRSAARTGGLDSAKDLDQDSEILPSVPATVRDAINIPIVNESDVLVRCYGVYGCFSIAQPFLSLARPINAFPLPPDVIRPNLCLFTRDNPDKCKRLVSVRSSTALMRRNRPFKILTHGYLEHGEKRWLREMKDAYLKYDDLNVIVLDWLSGSGPPYTQAVANIRLIGVIVGTFVMDLKHHLDVPPDNVHVVGHSLGAHLAGYVGDFLRKRGIQLGRITGLDPAEPYFEGTDPEVRLDPTDANLVDVLHTDAGPILSAGLGLFQASGHIDFYPNGGVRQPGCATGVVDSVAKEDGNIPYGLRRFIGCNHIRAYELFTESITSECPFLAIQCSSWDAYWKGRCWQCGEDWSKCARMGAHADTYLKYSLPAAPINTMYLITGEEKPFCSFHHRVTLIMSYTLEAQEHGGDIGIFFVTFYGDNGFSRQLQLNPEEVFFEPGNAYTFMVGAPDLGHLHSVDLTWRYITAYYNPLSWRLLSRPSVFVNRIHIDSIEQQERYEFCGLDRSFASGQTRTLEWRPVCPEQAPSPGASILGTIINFDVEDTINNNIDAFSSGLTSLGNGQLINSLASSTSQVAREVMSSARRSLDSLRRRRLSLRRKTKNKGDRRSGPRRPLMDILKKESVSKGLPVVVTEDKGTWRVRRVRWDEFENLPKNGSSTVMNLPLERAPDAGQASLSSLPVIAVKAVLARGQPSRVPVTTDSSATETEQEFE